MRPTVLYYNYWKGLSVKVRKVKVSYNKQNDTVTAIIYKIDDPVKVEKKRVIKNAWKKYKNKGWWPEIPTLDNYDIILNLKK